MAPTSSTDWYVSVSNARNPSMSAKRRQKLARASMIEKEECRNEKKTISSARRILNFI
jgi:hypothetical protein